MAARFVGLAGDRYPVTVASTFIATLIKQLINILKGNVAILDAHTAARREFLQKLRLSTRRQEAEEYGYDWLRNEEGVQVRSACVRATSTLIAARSVAVRAALSSLRPTCVFRCRCRRRRRRRRRRRVLCPHQRNAPGGAHVRAPRVRR